MFEVGRVCIKVAGREAGKYCVIVKKVDSKSVLVTGPRDITSVRRRKCSIAHLEPLMEKVKVAEDAGDDAVFKAWDEAGLFDRLGVKKPSPEQIAEARKRREEKAAKRSEEQKKHKEIKEKLEKSRAEKKTRAAKKPAAAKEPRKDVAEKKEPEKIPGAGLTKEEIEKEVDEELRKIDEDIKMSEEEAEKPKKVSKKKAE